LWNRLVRDLGLTSAGFLATVKEIRVPEEGPVQVVLDLGDSLADRIGVAAGP